MDLLVLFRAAQVDSIWACRMDRPGTTMLGSVLERNSGAVDRAAGSIPTVAPAPAPAATRPSCTLLEFKQAGRKLVSFKLVCHRC